MKIVDLDHVPKTKVDMEGAANTYKQTPISKKDGSPLFSFRVFTIEPEGHTPYHSHPFEHLNYVISGHGALIDEHRRENKIKQGDFALVLADETHQYRNDSEDEALVVICAVQKDYE